MQVLDDTNMHLVHFHQQRITAYVCYEAVETSEDEPIRTVNHPAAMIIREREQEVEQDQEELPVQLIASVPDIGLQFENAIVSRSLSHASRHFAFQRAKEHTLRLVLRGDWYADESAAPLPPPGLEWFSLFGHALLQLQCRDGLGTEMLLRPCPAIDNGPEPEPSEPAGVSSRYPRSGEDGNSSSMQSARHSAFAPLAFPDAVE